MTPRLTSELELEQLVSTPDGAGGSHKSWVSLGIVWAEVKPRDGREVSGEAGQVSVTGLRITVRAVPQGHSARPRAEQRFRSHGRVFRINAVTERDPEGRFLLCVCDEELAS